MKRALVVCTIVDFLNFELSDIMLLQELGYEVHCATNLKDGGSVVDELKRLNTVIHQVDFERTPFSINNIRAYRQLKGIMGKTHYDLVHCHTPMGGVLGRLCASKYRKRGTNIVYTAHGFHFFEGAPFKNWVLYYPIEKCLSKYTDVLITINKEDYEIAKKKFHAKRVEYVPGVGLDLSEFNHSEKSRYEKRIELGIKDSDTVLLSVGELNENKNHEAFIKALAQLNGEKSLDSVKYLICGQGEKKDTLEKLAEELGLKDIVGFLGFRTDVSEIYEAADVFVFPSFREGLSVALMEAMCCGLPVLCSSIRGNTDLIDENGGVLFAPDQNEEIVNALKIILNNKKETNSTMGLYNKNKIKHFDLNTVKGAINTVYGSIEQAQNVGGVTHLLDSLSLMELRESIGCKKDDILLLSVGELSVRKNHETVIKALSNIDCEHLKYVIVGQGKLKKHLQDVINEQKMEEHVSLLGFRSDVPVLCRAADVFMFPSLQEGLPVALMEAMASGLPCVASKIRGNVDLIDNNKGGYLAEPKTIIEWSNCLESVMKLSPLMMFYNQEKIKHFSLEIVERYMELIYRETKDVN